MSRPDAGDPRRSREDRAPQAVGVLGMWVFLAALAMLFAASVAGYVVVRLRAESWPPPGTPRAPGGLSIATAVLVGCSVTIHRALTSIRRGERLALRRWLVVTFVLGLAFLALQALNWRAMTVAGMPAGASLFAFTFYMLTGLHALHVLGGLVALAVVTVRAFGGRYGSGYHPGVLYASMYWHFLDVVWIGLFVILFSQAPG